MNKGYCDKKIIIISSLLLIIFLLISQSVFAIPPTLLYRADTRPPEEIFIHGFYPSGTYDGLVQHFLSNIGSDSVFEEEEMRSAFIGATDDFHDVALTFARQHIKDMGLNQTYIYGIVPDEHFYNVIDSIRAHITQIISEGKEDKLSAYIRTLREAIDDFEWEHEWIANQPIAGNRIRWVRRVVRSGEGDIDVEDFINNSGFNVNVVPQPNLFPLPISIPDEDPYASSSCSDFSPPREIQEETICPGDIHAVAGPSGWIHYSNLPSNCSSSSSKERRNASLTGNKCHINLVNLSKLRRDALWGILYGDLITDTLSSSKSPPGRDEL